jgi:tetratricopeptide (TPR) repeat protein
LVRRLTVGILGWIGVLGLALGVAAQEPVAEAAAAATEPPAAPPAQLGIAVLAPRSPEVLASIRTGVRVWLQAELARNEMPLIELLEVDQASAQLTSETRPHLFGTDGPELAEQLDLAYLVSTQLVYEEGEMTVWVRTFDADTGMPVTIGSAEGILANLGGLVVDAASPNLRALGANLTSYPPEAPRLGDLAGYARAWNALAKGSLADCWEELDGNRSPTADWLRAGALDVARLPQISVAERSRLASVRGVNDGDWLRVRHAIVEGKNPEMLVAGAANALARQDPGRALQLYDKAARLDPENEAATRGRARMQAVTGNEAAAAESFQSILAADPHDVEAHEALATNGMLPDATRAQHHLSAGQLRSDSFEVDSAQQQLKGAGKLGILDQARQNVARLNERMGNSGEALLAYEEVTATGQADIYAQLGLARTRKKAGDKGGAGTAYDAALSLDPQNADALRGKGELLLEEGNPEAALDHLTRSVSLAPSDAKARRALARAHQELGQPDAALTALDADAVGYDDRSGMLADAAAIHEAEGRTEQAQVTLERAVSIAPEDPPLRTSLARAYEANGDREAAARQEATLVALTGVQIKPTHGDPTATSKRSDGMVVSGPHFDQLVSSFPLRHPSLPLPIADVAFLGISEPGGWESQVRNWFLPRILDTAALEDAIEASLGQQYNVVELTGLPDVASGAYERVLGMGKNSNDISLVNDLLGVDASFRVELKPIVEEGVSPTFGPADRPIRLQARMSGGRASGDVFILAHTVKMPKPDSFVAWNLRAAVPGAVLLGLLIALFVRGWGHLEVNLHYQTNKSSKGFFSIQLSKKPGQAKREGKGKSKSASYQTRVRRWSRFARDMVGPKTTFRLMPARQYYVVVHGLLQDSSTKEVIGNYLEERRVKIVRGQTTEVSFDFRVKQAPITVQLARPDEMLEEQVLVAFKGDASSLRYVKDESVVLFADNGRHTIIVGAAGMVTEVTIEIVELQGLAVPIGVTEPSGATFTDCPDAVEPYVLGDYKAASKALDRAGQTELANSIRAEFHQERGENEEAAKFFEAAGNLTMAAELSAETEDSAHSATLFEQAGDYRRAAEGYSDAGDLIRAAQAFEAAYDFDAAIDAYRQAGDLAKTLELLEKTGSYYEAGGVSLEQGDKPRAIRNLQMVDIRDPDFAEACRALADLFAEQGEWDLAIDKAREGVNAGGEEHASLELHENLGILLEKAGRGGEALEVYEGIRKRDYTYEGIAERIEALREVAATQAAMETDATVPAGAAAPAAAAPARGGADDRYEILEEIGRGGMGVVYKARDTRLGRVVALKRLPDNLKDHPTAVQLFLREARSAAALNHQNIVTLFDAGETDDNYFITMELLEGFPLDAVLKKRGKLSAKDALRLIQQTATGLQYAHDQRIVHRDIKTSNLFFTKDRVVKIMDFGLAKMLEEVRRAATVIGGTPYYMAPEQASGGDLDHRADLYALGVTLFELLAGSVPFTDGDVTYHHRHTPPPDVRERAPEVPEALAQLIADLLEKEPDARPATTGEVVTRMDGILRSLG